MADISAPDNSSMAIAIRKGRPLLEPLALQVQGVPENWSYCNVSFSIVNTSPSSVTLDKIQIEGASVLTYINGTEIICPGQMSYDLNVRSTAQVNLIVPIANYVPNATISVYTPEALYYQDASVF
jgi:hypothetical protein